MGNVFIATAIVALTEAVKRAQAKDWEGVFTIAIAAGVGALAGLLGLQGLDIANGVVAGLAACGIHTVARQVG